MRSRPWFAGAAGALAAVVATAVPLGVAELPSSADRCGGAHWVGAWAAPPQSSSLGKADREPFGAIDGAARTFSDQTLRMTVVPSTAGAALRVHFGNRFGTDDVVIGAATVGRKAGGAALVPGSVMPLTFAGEPSVTIAAGSGAVSDPLQLAVEPFTRYAVTFHVAGDAPLDLHQWATATNHVTGPGSGDHTADVTGNAFVEHVGSVFGVTGIDVLAPRAVGAVVTLGDSITDGVGSSPDLDRRWPDHLARRLHALQAGLAVVNAGMGGNHVTTDGNVSPRAVGPSAVQRFAADVAAVAGVTDVVVFAGINDIGIAETPDTAARVIAGYRSIIREAHAAGLRVVGATLTPAAVGGMKEAMRGEVNEWIRTSGELDAVIDFDAVARDPADPSRLRAEHDAHLAHLNDAGYELLARSVDPAVFRGTGC